jgi:predicted dehydrogenase
MMSGLRSAIIGPGMVGCVHAGAVRHAGGELVAVCASTPERSGAAAQRLGASRAASAQDIFDADDVDVVHVCTPNSLHFEQVAAALAGGKSVICEKPLTTNVADAAAMVEAAERAHAVAAVPFVYRFYPTVREARSQLAGDSVWLMSGGYLQDHMTEAELSGWRSDAARSGFSMTFADIGSHWCDLAEFVTGHRIRSVVAAEGVTSPPSGRGDDGAVVAFRTDRGAIGSLVVSQASPSRKNELTFSFDGSRTEVRFNQERPDELVVGTLRSTSTLVRGAGLDERSERYSVLPAGHPQGYQEIFNSFVADVYEAIRTGCAPEGLPTFADGLRAAQIHDAVAASVAGGGWVDVGDYVSSESAASTDSGS